MITWPLTSPPLLAAISLVPLAITLLLLTTISTFHPLSIIFEWEITNLNNSPILITLLIDNISSAFSLTVVIISFSVLLFSSSYITHDLSIEYFIIMVLLFVLSINFLIFIPSILILLIGWDGLGLTSYLLVIYYQNPNSLAAGIVTVITNRIGDATLILGSAWALSSGHWNLAAVSLWVPSLTLLIVLVAAITNSAQIPFSAWLPMAIAAPTPVSALVHSSTLVTAGIYLLIRFFPSISELNLFYHYSLYTGMVTCLIAGLTAIIEYDLNNIIALSTLSQLGVIMMSLGINQPLIAFFHLITHALFNALLFLCAGTIIHNKQNTQDIRLIGNLWSTIPSTCVALNSANLALCGFPFIAGFYSNDNIVETFLTTPYPVITTIITLAAICLTSAYSLRLSTYSLWSPFNSSSLINIPDNTPLPQASYTILLIGAVTSGPIIEWTIIPSVQFLTLPFIINILTLTLIITLAWASYIITNYNIQTNNYHFTSSIWFLTLITSAPLVNNTLLIGQTSYNSEITWLEMLSGNGTLIIFSNVTHKAQKIQLAYFPQIISITTVLLLTWMIWT